MRPSPLSESEMLAHIKTGLDANTNLFIPAISANRGTFTCPVYSQDASMPVAVFRMEAGRKLVRHEIQVLTLVKEKGSPALQDSIPEVLWHGTWGTRSASLIEHLCGRQQTKPRTVRGFGKQLTQIGHWLSALHSIRRCAQFSRDPEILRIYHAPEALRQFLGEGALAETIGEALYHLAEIPRVLCHGDLHPGNILSDQNHIRVLDWEYATWGLPIFDWFYYLCALLFEQGRKRPATPKQWELAIRKRWNSTSRVSYLIHQRTASFLQSQGMEMGQFTSAIRLGIFDFLRQRLPQQSLSTLTPLIRDLGYR